MCSDWDLRLVNGSVLKEGRVEVCFNNTYGSICHDHWSGEDAQVVCRHLGYNSENSSALTHSFYGAASGPIHLTNVQCDGNEDTLQQCSHNQDAEECVHDEDAGVSCTGILPQAPLALLLIFVFYCL